MKLFSKSLLPTAALRDAFDRHGIICHRRAFIAYIRSGGKLSTLGLRRIRRNFARGPLDDNIYHWCFVELLNVARENYLANIRYTSSGELLKLA